MSQYGLMQILYTCEKCGELNAHIERIGASTVTTRLCPRCVTLWGQYFRSQDTYLAYREAEWAEKRAESILEAGRLMAEGTRYLEEFRRLALRWLSRDNRANWELERGATISVLRGLCGEFGDNDWDDNLHLVDVLEKHLEPHLEEKVHHE